MNANGLFMFENTDGNYEEQKLNILTKNVFRKNALARLVQASLRRCDILGIFMPISHMILFEKVDGKWVPNLHSSEKLI